MLGLDAGDTSEDAKLLLLIEQASALIEEFMERPIALKQRTEWYQGTGTQRLVLKCRPAYVSPAPIVYVSEGTGYFGQASGSFQSSGDLVTYGDGCALQVDQEDTTKSRSGILWRMGGKCWPKPVVRQRPYLSPFQWYDTGSIQVTYTAGYTVDNLPSQFRLAANLLIMRLRYIMPIGYQITSESYEERSVSLQVPDHDDLMSIVRPLLWPWKNHNW